MPSPYQCLSWTLGFNLIWMFTGLPFPFFPTSFCLVTGEHISVYHYCCHCYCTHYHHYCFLWLTLLCKGLHLKTYLYISCIFLHRVINEWVTSHFQFVLQILQRALRALSGSVCTVPWCWWGCSRARMGVCSLVWSTSSCVPQWSEAHGGGHYHCSCIWNNWPKAGGWDQEGLDRCTSAETACLLYRSDWFHPPPVSGSHTVICGLRFCDVKMFLCLPWEKRCTFMRWWPAISSEKI